MQSMTDLEQPLAFKGRVGFRSSKGGDGPPGETAILDLNPQRRIKILEATGWSRLEPGSLNLDVDNSSFDLLLKQTPLLVEPSETIVYPEPYAQIPARRKAYLYYAATARAKNKTYAVLVRRAKVPGPIRVELFAPESLKAFFGLLEGDTVEVEVGGAAAK